MTDIAAITINELESLLEEYPWFTLARKEYVRRQREMGEDALRRAAAEAGLHLLSRAEFVDELQGKKRKVVRTAPVEPVAAPAETKTEEKKFFVVGGDYFDKSDYQELEESGAAFDTSALAFNPIASALGAMEQDVKIPQIVHSSDSLGDDSFCTETLARIYLEQEFYQRAIEVYEKLILLYPKKSAYFATLIEQAKNIKQ